MAYKDKEKQKAFQRVHYKENKELFLKRNRQRRLDNLEFIIDFKKNNPCKCGEANVVCLDLHHVDPKTKDETIAQAIRDWGIDRLRKELLKCIVFCSNCHRKHHRKDILWVKDGINSSKRIRNREWILKYKEEHPCKCGEFDLWCLEFHHLHKKEIDIPKAICDYGLKRLQQEVDKCMVVCSNCHRKIHGDFINV